MAHIVKEPPSPKPRRATCTACKSVIEYMPNEASTFCYSNDQGERIACPREGCNGYGYRSIN